MQAFRKLSFTTEESQAVWRIVAAVAHIGNCTFDSEGGDEGVEGAPFPSCAADCLALT